MSEAHPRWGYRKIWAVLRREGWGVNRKRVHRLWQQHGLQVPRRGRRVRKTGPRGPVTRAAYRNHVWSVDFVFDQTMDAWPLKCLTVVTARSRQVPDYDTAQRLRRDVESTVALGRRWEPQDAHAIPALIEVSRGEVTGGLFTDVLKMARGQFAPGTIRHYDRALRRFYLYLGRRHPRLRRLTLDLLNTDVLLGWFGELREGGLAVSTARLYVTAVRAAWEWGAYDSEVCRHLTPRPPRRIRQLPPPTHAPVQAPSFEQMDATISAAHALARSGRTSQHREAWMWRARLATLLRFTGLRADSQAMQLRWADLDLESGEMVVRGELGKSRRERTGRIVPLSEHLVAELAGWGPREGFVIAPDKTDRHSDPRRMAKIWKARAYPSASGAPDPDGERATSTTRSERASRPAWHGSGSRATSGTTWSGTTAVWTPSTWTRSSSPVTPWPWSHRCRTSMGPTSSRFGSTVLLKDADEHCVLALCVRHVSGPGTHRVSTKDVPIQFRRPPGTVYFQF